MRDTTEFPDKNQGNLELDDQEVYNVQVWACSQLGYTNLKMGVLGLTIRCKYWRNDDHFSTPFSSSKIRTAPKRIPRKSRIGWPARSLQCASLSLYSARVYESRDENTWSHHQMQILVEWRRFFYAIFIIKNTNRSKNNTKEISNWMTKETTKYKFELAFSSGIRI